MLGGSPCFGTVARQSSMGEGAACIKAVLMNVDKQGWVEAGVTVSPRRS